MAPDSSHRTAVPTEFQEKLELYVCVVIGVCEIGGKNGKYEEIFILDAPGNDGRNRKGVAFFV